MSTATAPETIVEQHERLQRFKAAYASEMAHIEGLVRPTRKHIERRKYLQRWLRKHAQEIHDVAAIYHDGHPLEGLTMGRIVKLPVNRRLRFVEVEGEPELQHMWCKADPRLKLGRRVYMQPHPEYEGQWLYVREVRGSGG